jgi:hypothetical protein
MNESRFIELFDVNPANGGEPKLVHRIPPANATETGGGLAGVEDWIYFSPLSRFLVTWQPVDKVKKGEGTLPLILQSPFAISSLIRFVL